MKQRVALAAGLLATALTSPGSALAADPILPLSEVRPGLQCTGLSVIRGTTISEFGVEVIDVIRGDSSVGPRILVRVSGPAVDETGIASGFSGSPVLCTGADGVRRNAGALSAGIGDYGDEVGLATPIEAIIGQKVKAPRSARRAPRLLRSARPIATPLTVSGLSGASLTRLRAASRRTRTPVLAAPAGPFGGFAVQPLVPGAAVSTGLSSGDVSVGGIGTVAYRDGSTVWAFGHALDGVGRRSLLLQDAFVYTVIGNPLAIEGASSYKLAVAGHTVGTLSNDTFDAVIGSVGAAPRTVPVTVTALDSDTGRTRTLQSRVTDERSLDLGSPAGLVADLSLSQALTEVLGSASPALSGSMCVRVRVRERKRPLGFCRKYFDVSEPFDDLSEALSFVDDYEFGKLTPVAISVRARVNRGLRRAFITGARTPRTVRPGTTIGARLALRESRGRAFSRTVSVKVPEGLAPGRRTLRVRGVGAGGGGEGESLDDVFEIIFEGLEGGGGSNGGGPRSIPALAAAISRLGREDGVRAGFAKKRAGPVVLLSPELLILGKANVAVRVAKPPKDEEGANGGG